MGNKKQSNHAGFAVLTIVLLLSLASLIYTLNMAQVQLLDNQLLANDYRNKEALLHAESGVSLMLNQLNHANAASQLLNQLPFVYPDVLSSNVPFQVQLSQQVDQPLQITSTGYSQDLHAMKQIVLTLQAVTRYGIPESGVTSNAALTLNDKAKIQRDCESQGCTDAELAAPLIDARLFNSPLCLDSASLNLPSEQINLQQQLNPHSWGTATSFAGTFLDNAGTLIDMNTAQSLFEKTFGTYRSDALYTLSMADGVITINTEDTALKGDMNTLCRQALQQTDDNHQVLYIQGDCDLTSNTTPYILGSSEYPKIIFIEGGRFISQAGVRINGLLYYLPGKQPVLNAEGEKVYLNGVLQTMEEQTVNLTGVQVNGALLSEYACSYNTQEAEQAPFLWVNYNQDVLNTLYQQLTVLPLSVQYKQAQGSWRDF